MGYLNHKYLHDCIRDILWIVYSSPPGAPAALRALRRHRARVATTLFFAPSFDTAMRRSSVSGSQPPTTRFAPPKLPQPLFDLVHVASLPARLVGCICQPMWKPGASLLAELVWDGRSRFADTLNGFRSSRSWRTAPVPPCRSA